MFRVFDDLEEGAKEEVRALAEELDLDLEDAALDYLKRGRSLAIVERMKAMKRKAQVIAIEGHKKGLFGEHKKS